jgi:hypothetical protein
MPTLTVIKHFDVIKNIASGFAFVPILLIRSRFSTGKLLQPRCRGSYRDDSCCLPDRVISGTTATMPVLTTLIEVNQYLLLGITPPYRHK